MSAQKQAQSTDVLRMMYYSFLCCTLSPSDIDLSRNLCLGQERMCNWPTGRGIDWKLSEFPQWVLSHMEQSVVAVKSKPNRRSCPFPPRWQYD